MGRPAKRISENADDLIITTSIPDLIEPGEYLVRVLSSEKSNKWKGIMKLYLHCVIEPPCKYDGTFLYMSINLENPYPGPSSKLFKTWTLANWGVGPRRIDRMPIKTIIGGTFRAKVRTVKSIACEYSIIDHFIKRVK